MDASSHPSPAETRLIRVNPQTGENDGDSEKSCANANVHGALIALNTRNGQRS